ncbi:MAG: hypothetical protein FWD61_01135 [Phycisphaerales bacterium]|nr:hypothetical protein [Phycisphaerales bacterium]
MRITGTVLCSMILVTCVLLVGCKRGPRAEQVYGRASNPDRKVRGLPVIPDTWVERGGGYQADWNNPAHADQRTTHDTMHTYKELLLDKTGNPRQESDYYQSGKQYHGRFNTHKDEKSWEEISITYDFQAAKDGKNPWRCSICCGPHEKRPDGRPDGELTLEEAEAILKEWGLTRLNY